MLGLYANSFLIDLDPKDSNQESPDERARQAWKHITGKEPTQEEIKHMQNIQEMARVFKETLTCNDDVKRAVLVKQFEQDKKIKEVFYPLILQWIGQEEYDRLAKMKFSFDVHFNDTLPEPSPGPPMAAKVQVHNLPIEKKEP